jgi:AraC family transcriptional regulator
MTDMPSDTPGRRPRTEPVSAAVEDEKFERVTFATALVGIGSLRSPIDSPYFRGEHFTNNFVIAFPRSAFWIRQNRGRPFVADPTVVTIYNKSQFHERRHLGSIHCNTDWFAVSEVMARDAVSNFDPEAAEISEPFRFTNTHCSPALYREQRMIFEAAQLGRTSVGWVEERVIHLLGRVLKSTYAQPVDVRQTETDRTRRDLVERAKEVIAARYSEDINVQEIARRCGCSVFHLCRTFRLLTGQTLHGFRRDLRLRIALGLVGDHRRELSTLALELGFSSHSHFSNAFREHFGQSPGVLSGHTRTSRSRTKPAR